MKYDNGLHRVVYDYYETQIRFGFYRCGDTLPSIANICSAFRLGRTTIRTALDMLEKEMLIKTEERKPARVIFKATPAQLAENMARYFLPRRDGIFDLLKAGEVLIEPLREGEQRNLLHFRDNRLILNFYSEAARYLRYPYLVENICPIFTGPRYEKQAQELFEYVDEISSKYSIQPLEPVPFRWNIYRQRPQMRYTLASRIIREIMYGKYPIGSYLPSLPRMEKQYDVSLTTLRRTLSLLSELGVTRSFQGKGTQVLMKPGSIDFSKAEIKAGMELYGESLQFLALTISSVSRFTLEAVSEKKREALRGELERIRKSSHSCYCFETFLGFIRRECPLAAVRECYGRVEELLAWGYPAALLRAREGGLNAVYEQMVSRMETHLQEGAFAAFSADWKELLECEEQLSLC